MSDLHSPHVAPQLETDAPLRAVAVLAAGAWRRDDAADRVVLTYEERHRRRWRFVAEGGTTFLLDLPRAALLREGEGLRLSDGRIVAVEAAPEDLVQVTTREPQQLMRIAWHIGNRHLPAQLEPRRILIRDDAVIVEMLRGLSATVVRVFEAFTPEAGAYDGAHHSHD